MQFSVIWVNQWISGQNVKIWINCNKTWTLCCISISLQSHWYTMKGSFFLSGLHIAWFLKWPFHPFQLNPFLLSKVQRIITKRLNIVTWNWGNFITSFTIFLCGTTHLLCVLYHSLYSLDVMVVLSPLLFGSHVKVKERKQMENKKIMSLQIIFASMRLLILSTLCCYFIH